MPLFTKLSAAIGATFILTACSSSGSPPICFPIGSDGQVVSTTAGTQVDSATLAFDGDISSAAELYTISGTGTAVFEANGNRTAGVAGILLGLPSGQVTQVSITTSLNGVPVASGNAGTQSDTSSFCSGTCVQSGGRIFMGISASSDFNEIEATIEISGTTEDTLVYELCTRR